MNPKAQLPPSDSWEEVCERENLLEALRRAKGNKGSAGIDGMTVGQLSGYLKEHWLTIREQLLNGTYKRQAAAENRHGEQTSLPKSRRCRHVITHLFSSGYAR